MNYLIVFCENTCQVNQNKVSMGSIDDYRLLAISLYS